MGRLTRYNRDRDLLSQINEDFNRLLTPFSLGLSEQTVSDWIPSIDVKEEDKQYTIHVDVPGVKPSDIDVNMENGLLTIRGHREVEKKEERENYLREERSRGSFLRKLSLPETIDADKIQAKCQHGVLEITLPKTKQSTGRKIEVKS